MSNPRLILAIFAIIISSLLWVGSSVWPMRRDNEDDESEFDPPSWVFGVAWGLIWLSLISVWLYITFKHPNMKTVAVAFVVYSIFFGLSFIWPYVYSKNIVHAYWLLWFMVLIGWWVFSVSCSANCLIASFTIILPVWLSFATTLI